MSKFQNSTGVSDFILCEGKFLTFFLIVPSVIIIGVFLIHGVFNRVGLRIHYGALIICVVLSIMANVGMIFFSSAPDKFYFIRLGGLILTSALLGTLANYFFVRREIREQEKFSEEVQIAYQEKTAEEVENPTEEPETESVEEEKISVPVKKVDLVKKNLPKKKITPKKLVDLKKKPVAKKISEVKPTAEKPETPPAVPVQKVEPKKISVPVQKVPEKISEPQENPEEVKFTGTAETLDDLLDLAYLEKTKGNIWQAVAAYKKALEKYRGDSYAPFVAIDLGNLYKEQAMYAKAIKIFEDALDLPAVKRNFSTAEKFKKNIIYLKAVQSVLLRHQELRTPFSKISKVYLQEIESEFQSAQIK